MGLTSPEIPEFATHAQERQHRKERLVAACRAFAQQGFDYGFAGHRRSASQNHGLLTASRHSIESAAFWFIALERCCRQQLLVDATGMAPKLVSPERARYSREHVGSDYIGWLHFQPIYDYLAQSQPNRFA